MSKSFSVASHEDSESTDRVVDKPVKGKAVLPTPEELGVLTSSRKVLFPRPETVQRSPSQRQDDPEQDTPRTPVRQVQIPVVPCVLSTPSIPIVSSILSTPSIGLLESFIPREEAIQVIESGFSPVSTYLQIKGQFLTPTKQKKRKSNKKYQ